MTEQQNELQKHKRTKAIHELAYALGVSPHTIIACLMVGVSRWDKVGA